jgi:hypothetical protein
MVVGCISSFRRLSVIRVWYWHHFYRHVLKTVVRFPDLERGEVYGQHYFFFFIGLENFNTEFRLKSLFWVYYLDAFFSIRFPVLSTESNIQTKVQYKEMVH